MFMRANEKAFQAWYAAYAIQEFGLAHVYREVHLKKNELFELAGDVLIAEKFRAGNELFPDLSVSWEPDIDARHSSTRPKPLSYAGSMLSELGLVSELKVSASTMQPTSPVALRQDLAKLAIFSAAYNGTTPGTSANPLLTYMVVLDNNISPKGHYRGRFSPNRMATIFDEVAAVWPERADKPVILVARCKDDRVLTDVYRGFEHVTTR
jgi:hypothetical protein